MEMLEIKNLLNAYKASSTSEFQIDFKDHQLQWGAGLSSYKNDIPALNAKNIIGIELIEDIPVPLNYICIDHHSEKSDRPSSLEQVADLLKVALDRHQMLVAINDRSYIPGMLEFGATKEEIDEIRYKDRRAQGITENDEKLAETALHNAENFGNLIVVFYEGKRFSPITDIVQIKHLIIWNRKTLTYYGPQTADIKEHYKPLIPKEKFYYGGNPLSFFGLGPDNFSSSEIGIIKDNMIRIIRND